ncbi:hypothetical protein [Hwangdonia sp.]|uniref:hypothetical protein n=1 Tax=Hwangdonia sp. TaxID=1883432 RepID=UPI003AB85B16
MTTKSIYITVLILSGLFLNSLYSQNNQESETHKNSGFLDFNGYYDSRRFSTFTINALANLSYRLQYFSLTNFQGSDSTTDLSTFYTEQNLRWKIKGNSPLDLTVQWVARTGNNNDNFRLGVRWKLNETNYLQPFFKKLHFAYSINFHLLQFTTKAPSKLLPQIEHVYRLNLLPSVFKNRLYLGGFADQNMVYQDNGNISFKWVSEHQIGYNICNSFFIILEYRINDFLPSDNYGLGYGLEYKMTF